MKVKTNSAGKLIVLASALYCAPFPTAAISAPANQTTSATVVQQVTKLKGTVLDAKTGEPIIGANVLIKGTSIGTITDYNGNYEFEGTIGAKLIISFVGYKPMEITSTAQSQTTKLHEDSEALDEVVVVGYGTQRKSSITGSIASVNADKLKDVTTPSVANMLQGKVAGVQVSPTSGQPGAGVSIRVRGIGSITGSKEPLWVIDGVVGDAVAELNPNDIESISILKDGSATALYGSRGANGVVLVTTKRGAAGVSQFDASVKFGVSQLQRGKLRMMTGAEYYDYLETAYRNAGTLSEQKWLQPYLRDRNFDWWDFATQNALTQNYNISYKYGNEKIKSYISGDYYTEEGAIKGFDYKRFTMRSNTDYVVNDRLTLKSKIAISYKETFNQQHSLAYTSYSPWDTPYNSKGEIKTGKEGAPSPSETDFNPDDKWFSDGSSNYLYDLQYNWSKKQTNAMDIGFGFDFKIFDWLTFESNNKVGFNNSNSDIYTDPESQAGAAKRGTFRNESYNTRSIYTSQMLRMLKTFNEVHEINAFLGYDYDEYRYRDLNGEASNIYPGAGIVNAGASNEKASGTKTEEKNAAIFFNGNYSYAGKYLFQVMVRRDGSSRFGSNKRWATFWSVGGGWNMHEEDFIKNIEWINQLKPRISYGISGNLPGGAYEWVTKFDITQQYGDEIAFYSNYSGNPNLS